MALREQYAPELSGRVDEIEHALAAGDGPRAAAIGHGLAGSAHVLGAQAFGDAAAAVGKVGNASAADQAAAVRHLRAALAAAMGSTAWIDRTQRLTHDLRSSLTAVLGYAELLHDLDLDPPAMAMVDGILAGGHAIRRRLDEESSAMDARGPDPQALDPAARSGERTMDAVVVDDDPLVRDVIVAVLRGVAGVSARAADAIESAVLAIEEHVPELLIVDLHLGGTDSGPFVQEARRRCPTTFIAVLTGDDPALRRDELHGLGADIVVAKGPPEAVRLLVEAARRSR